MVLRGHQGAGCAGDTLPPEREGHRIPDPGTGEVRLRLHSRWQEGQGRGRDRRGDRRCREQTPHLR